MYNQICADQDDRSSVEKKVAEGAVDDLDGRGD